MRKRRGKTTEQRVAQEVIRLRNIRESQALLRAKDATSQAGFTAERIPSRLFARRPILIDDGPGHAQHRKQLVRFFSPRALEERHRAFIERTAAEYVTQARKVGSCQVDVLGLQFSVRVASEIVGLTAGDTPALAKRLEAFFKQPPVDHTRTDHGRTRDDWIQAAQRALIPLASFYWRDVLPAVRARRAHPSDDIISHLLAHGYRPREILMECLTYGTAGMVTTREFISMTMLRMFNDSRLCSRYLEADEPERLSILNEIIRLEPPVAHLYRRVQARADGCPYDPGALVDIDVRQTNLDPDIFTPEPKNVCTDRQLTASERAGLSFGDGAHRCPGSHLALLETDVLVRALFDAGAVLERSPDHEFDTLVQGYQLRGFTVTFSNSVAAP